MSKSKIGLSSFIKPVDFCITKPYVVHQSKSVEQFVQLPMLKSLEHLIEIWPFSIQAHLPVPLQKGATDEINAIDVTKAEAHKNYKNGKPLLFNKVDRMSPLLKKWLDAIHADLCLPKMTYRRCMVYATPHGKGTAPHFDQNINFVLQLTGTKTWWLAKNKHVELPSQRHTMGMPLDPELASYCKQSMPKQMPTNSKKVILKPGSLLFVPRGYWHSTFAKTDALSLNFTFSQPSWVDLFTAALRSRLLLSPEWRDLPLGVTSKSIVERENAADKLDILLAELTYDLPNWCAADILESTEGLKYQ